MFPHTDSKKLKASATNADSCRAKAFELYDLYDSNYPLFWQLIDYDREKLAAIFEFFCNAQQLLLTVPTNLMTLLKRRLIARDSGGPPPIPFGFEHVIKRFSDAQIPSFRKLGALVKPAFELFAASALTGKRQFRQHEPPVDVPEAKLATLNSAAANDAGADADADDLFEPDGPAFFYWAEFAFIAAYAGHDSDEWREILPVLIRAERIYALAYGKSVRGAIPSGTKFSSYSILDFSPIHPNHTKRIPYPLCLRFDSLENEATASTHFAFPGGVD